MKKAECPWLERTQEVPVLVTAVHHGCITRPLFNTIQRLLGEAKSRIVASVERLKLMSHQESGLQACYGKPPHTRGFSTCWTAPAAAVAPWWSLALNPNGTVVVSWRPEAVAPFHARGVRCAWTSDAPY